MYRLTFCKNFTVRETAGNGRKHHGKQQISCQFWPWIAQNLSKLCLATGWQEEEEVGRASVLFPLVFRLIGFLIDQGVIDRDNNIGSSIDQGVIDRCLNHGNN